MRKVFWCFLLANLAFSAVATAGLPSFSVTSELEYCIQRTNDWDACMKEAALSNLNNIKMKYRNLLADKTLLKFNSGIAGNKQLLHDMYESWTAYRNRLCALDELASQYSGPLVDQNLSCTLLQMEIHAYNMDRLSDLMQQKTPKKQAEFDFLRFEHDEEYKDCTKTEHKNEQKNCLKEEMTRTNEQILQKYQEAYASPTIGAWNNGPNLQNGNYRDMYDSWQAYRNRFCSLAVWAYKRAYGQNSISMNYCLESFNKNMLANMQDIMLSSVSYLDEDIPEELENYFIKPEDAGKKITPLERRFDTLKGFNDVALKDKKQAPEEPQIKKEKPQETEQNLPSWAKSAQ